MTRTRVTMARCEMQCVRTEHLLILVVAFLLLLVPVRAQTASGSDITTFGPSFATQKRRLAERALAVTRDTPIADNLQSLLTSSFDAIVVTDTRRRVVAANPIALHFWGISKANIKHFTLDAFLSTPEIPYFDSSDSPSKGRQESHGECKSRRLDGRMLVADYIFVPNFTPFRHLCRFWNDREWPSRRRDHALISTLRSVFHTQPLTGTRVLDARLSGR